ncbi:MAG TPA: hypothetical protein PLN61_10740 [bacterium]|nr:hypothetical protein [bacterium]HQI49126.1 hypothetical protein [bacterium]HQJ62987.1 hypothetical protein [bacterium]
MRILHTYSLILLLTGWAQRLHPDSPSRVEKYSFYICGHGPAGR